MFGGEQMARPRKAPPEELPDALALRRRIPVQEAAAILGIHEDTFRKHYSGLIRKIGPRLERVELGEVFAIGK
jgi:hypothetical protein